ncbi:McrC family protein [Priestia aryabhattai]|uniref:McrC family protein n=1 Tax=Priestia aryabhattai TaxID=412384 RepID=UPI001FB2BC03|nr:McrC family protein [Priestia aryabhattai]
MSSEQAEAFRLLGLELITQLPKQNGNLVRKDRKPTLISCNKVSEGQYEVTVRNAIGLIGIGGLTILVKPKIPMKHFLWIFTRASRLPRMSINHLQGGQGENLHEIIILTFLKKVRELIQQGILTEYQSIQEKLSTIRGRVNITTAVRSYLMGRLQFECEYDERTIDHSLNRILKAAAKLVSQMEWVPEDWKRQARVIMSLFEGAGKLLPSDLIADTDRRSYHYKEALVLAKNILNGMGLTFKIDNLPVSAFLLPTPDIIETGIRTILAEGMSETVEKKRFLISGCLKNEIFVNPDLVFNSGEAIGDIKYKLSKAIWNREDLYQVTAFAAAADTKNAVLINFRQSTIPKLPTVKFGEILVSQCTWQVDIPCPEKAAIQFLKDIDEWIIKFKTNK